MITIRSWYRCGVTTAVLLGEPLTVELMNTINCDRTGPHDSLADDVQVAAWLDALAPRLEVEAGVTLTPDDIPAVAGRLRQLRDALRVLAADITHDTRPRTSRPGLIRADAVATLNEAGRMWPEIVWPDSEQPTRVLRAAGTHADRAVALFAHQGVELFGTDQRHGLRACQGPNCLLFFVKDHARREWCSAACGNRARVQRHYQRHRDGAQP